MRGWEATLYLENGHQFEGEGFGAESAQGGEAVFNTGMTGYQEIFTDPSYYKQVVVMGYPHIGNTGVNELDLESKGLFLSGVVVREYTRSPSSWRMKQSLGDYLAAAKVPGISEVDTREITQILRDEGSQRAVIFPTKNKGAEDSATYAKARLDEVESMEGLELVSQVSCKDRYEFHAPPSPAGSIVVYDYGVKTNILRGFATRNFKVTVVPYNYPYEETLALDPTAVVLSNGPGDPAEVKGAVEQIQGLVGRVPTLAICMGHQLLARSLGCKTYKLKFGHHGINHPVKDLISGKILITSQNHGFSVKASDLNHREVQVSHLSLNDQTVEGFYSEKMKFYSVQFHPEAKPGPNDAASIFEYFVRGFLQ
jgi:carbamoyl-phosphate synthase small subunit